MSIRKLPSGNFRVQIRLQGLRPISRTFSKKSDAKAFDLQVRSNTELARKLGAASSNVPTFQTLVTLYMEQYTLRDYNNTIGRLSWWCKRFGNTPVTKIDEHMVDDGLGLLAETRTGSTVNRYKSTLSAVLIFFIRHPDFKRLGYTNPTRKESVNRYKENPAKDRFLTHQEQAVLLAACKQSSWDRLYLITLMALTTGARKGELLGLKWTAIDFKARTAHLGMTKTGKPRLLPLTQPVIEELLRYREREHKVFPSTTSKDTSRDFSKVWHEALAAAEIGHCRFHDLRHTAASNLVRAGRTLFEVATLLGHSNTTMTARYSHLAVDDTRDMVDDVMGALR